MDSSLKALAIKKLAMQLINTGFIINKFFVKAKAKNIAVIGVREHPATTVSYTHLRAHETR